MTDQLACPYCRMAFDEQGPPKIFCTACGMAHHEDCYMENGGCTVFGCPKAPADDPKMQVSMQDVHGVVMQQPQYPVYGQPIQVAVAPYAYPQPMAGRSTKSRTTFIVLG